MIRYYWWRFLWGVTPEQSYKYCLLYIVLNSLTPSLLTDAYKYSKTFKSEFLPAHHMHFLENYTGRDANNLQLTLAQVMAWCCQVTSHYLSQWWPNFMSSPYGWATIHNAALKNTYIKYCGLSWSSGGQIWKRDFLKILWLSTRELKTRKCQLPGIITYQK